eukprot:CAMPEP_0198214740 /NCGR_PEP_ID=MMETSP1445-20131203/43743_1 /TAXON_ID=36898 /ORGANISM="Pyramimonas sp., Strain CCMP2087" /LENGTH=319 /DNA_ID=CAMNT_0043890053 /DNA_START=603 /DNA_END=1562 /DNA_ORIENTATION=+
MTCSVRIVSKETGQIQRVPPAFAIVDLEIVHDDIVGLQAARDGAVGVLAGQDILRGDILVVFQLVFGDYKLVHVFVQVALLKALDDGLRFFQHRVRVGFVHALNLDAPQQGVVQFQILVHVVYALRVLAILCLVCCQQRVDNHVLDRLSLFVRVHAIMHTCTIPKELVHVTYVSGLEANLVVDHFSEPQQAVEVAADFDVAVLSVSREVVHFVYVDAVSTVRDDIAEEGFLPSQFVSRQAGSDQSGHALLHVFVDVQRVLLNQPFPYRHRVTLMAAGVPSSLVRLWKELVLEDVTEGAMADIVAEPGIGYRFDVEPRQV